MGFIYENIKKWLREEVANSGDPQLFLWYIKDALEEIEDEMKSQRNLTMACGQPSAAADAES